MRLLIGRRQVTPSVVTSGTQTIVARFRVSACSGRPVQGALVYVTAVPFVQFSAPPEATTGADGWAELRMNRLRGYPASPKQQLLVMLARAPKSSESLLGGISTRPLGRREGRLAFDQRRDLLRTARPQPWRVDARLLPRSYFDG